MDNLEKRLHYGEYKKIELNNASLPKGYYDEETKEMVFYISDIKRYKAENKDGVEFVFYTMNKNDRNLPGKYTTPYMNMVKNGHEKQEFMSYAFQGRMMKNELADWKYIKSEENISFEELVEGLKNNKFY